MRNTFIEQEQGFLGNFPSILEAGDTQSLVFSDSDPGPFWLSDAKKKRAATTKDLEVSTMSICQQAR
jgi:hypothetical protein